MGFERFWTDDKLKRLEELAATVGLSASEIALDLGCSRNSVIGKCFREEIPLMPQATASMLAVARRRQPQPHPKPLPLPPDTPHPESLEIEPETISDKQCRYPHGDGPYKFCGQPVEAGGWYCASHRARTHVLPVSRKAKPGRPAGTIWRTP